MTFTNDRETSTSLILEPWGEIYPIEPHMRLTIYFRSPIPPSSSQAVEVEYGADQITVYAWEGCTVALFQNGVELGLGAFPRPRVPQGLETLKRLGFFRETMKEVLAKDKQQNGS